MTIIVREDLLSEEI